MQESIQQLEKEIAEILAQTQGAFLTSVRGIGIIPRVKQTGGPQGETQIKKVGKRCNRILKDYVVKSASHIGKHGPDELMSDYKRRDAQDQHADFGMARRYLRMALCLMRSSQTYLPPKCRNTNVKMEKRAEYYLMAWLAGRAGDTYSRTI